MAPVKAPEIVECTITRRTTHYGTKGEIRPGLYAFSEIHMLDENGVNYLSRTWEELPDTPFMRAHQISEFKKRWERNERADHIT
jgi:hypothetical protein